MMTKISSYYNRIINLITELYHDEFRNALPGHCMKITGLNKNELDVLWERIVKDYSHISTFIVSNNTQEEQHKYIGATKLIELRNQQSSPLLILIPANNRTAAEDSYGNATFKEINLEIIERELYKKLISEIPAEYKDIIKSIIDYPYPHGLEKIYFINYLLELKDNGFTDENIGGLLFHLSLIPDKKLLSEREKLKARINFNVECTELLSNFGKPVYDRISELPIESNTIQPDIVNFFKKEQSIKTRQEICSRIYNDYPQLNFLNWKIPDLNFGEMELFVDDIISKDFSLENGKKVLNATRTQGSKIRIRIRTSPNPIDIVDLKYFRIVLMEVDGASGREVMDLRKLKNSATRRPYRDAQVELNPSTTEEGSYFFRVFAEDEHGSILNSNDKFKDVKIQGQWEKEYNELNNRHSDSADLSEKLKQLKIEYNFKKICDSDDFDFIAEEEPIDPPQARRDKIDNALQGYFLYRIGKLKSKGEPDVPLYTDDSGIWLNDSSKKLNSTFYLKFNNTHNYQINIPSKFRKIESLFLKNAGSLGFADIHLFNNPSANSFKSSIFKSAEFINKLIPSGILNKRKELFDLITKSTKDSKGIFETFDYYNHIDLIKDYLSNLTAWTTQLRDKFNNLTDVDSEEKAELQRLFIDLQNIDTVHLTTKLPDHTPLDVIVLSPLHPLRLSWHMQLFDLFSDWEQKTFAFERHLEEWNKNLDYLFSGYLIPENNPLILVSPQNLKAYQYAGELFYGWGIYIKPESGYDIEAISSVNRQLKTYLRNLLNISSENYIDTDISQKLVVKHIKNYLIQHPYTDKIIINLFNAGDANTFAQSLVELEKETNFEQINYEIRLFRGSDNIINHGESLKNLINPEYNVSEKAEAFSQPSHNKLFPKLRFSVNNIKDYISEPDHYTAHISFLVNPFPSKTELIKVRKHYINFFLNGVLTSPTVITEKFSREIKWNRFIYPNSLNITINDFSNTGIELFSNIQSFVAGALTSHATESYPSTLLHLNKKDNVLISLLHDYSDWVITFDKNLGPQIFDQPSKDGHIPFLLDYIPGEELSGISSYLTTRPTSEILGLLVPHFEEFNIDLLEKNNEKALGILLEDLRAISSSLVLQLNSSKNKAFEVIGSAFTKRVLEKKNLLKESFLIPIDLHQNLFENTVLDSKSRADNLLIKIDCESRTIVCTVIEIKCRKSLNDSEKADLKEQIKKQITNTISTLRLHFDPENNLSFDRLDRQIKNKELKSLLEFYILRANRYEYLDDQVCQAYLDFLNTIDTEYKIRFRQLGLIFDFGSAIKHHKEVIDSELTFFTFGNRLINDILDPDSDLNTRRLEEDEFGKELRSQLGLDHELSDFMKRFENNEPSEYIHKEKIKNEVEKKSTMEDSSDNQISSENQDKIEISAESNTDKANNSVPDYDILVGKSSGTEQYGILGKSIHGKTIALDLSETNTISLFGVQGGGKSYTIGVVAEMVLKEFRNVNRLPSPLAGVIFHYSESMDYAPEFTSMKYSNDSIKEIDKLKSEYGVDPDNIEDIIILTPKDKMEERQKEYPNIPVYPIAFNSMDLNVQDWLFLLGAVGNDSTYIKQLKTIMKENRKNLTLQNISDGIEATELLSNTQKSLARQKLNFASEYIDDSFNLKEVLRPGRLIIVDLRDEFIVKDDALGLFVIMLNIFSSVKTVEDKRFNKFIVFDEAHKYMDNKSLTNNIVTAIREMRHKGVSIMIASQDPPSLPNEIIELSSVVITHKFNSPQWLKHVQKSITQLSPLRPADLSALNPGEAFLWATKAIDKGIMNKPTKIITRPRVTKHGGGTIRATDY